LDNGSDTLTTTGLKECRHGRMLYLRGDHYIGGALEAYGEYGEIEGRLFAALVRPGDVVVEVGANIGAHTVHLAKLVGAAGRVVAFEPQRVIHQMLCANLALNEIFNTHALNLAAGVAPGKLVVPPVNYAGPGNFGGVAMTQGAAGEAVRVIPLDALALPSLRLLKVDVEGMEAEVLEGARGLIARHRPLLYVENDRQAQSPRLVALIEALGYGLWWHLPHLFNPDNFAGNRTNIYANTISINMLCVPNEMPTRIEGMRRVTGPQDWWQPDAPATEQSPVAPPAKNCASSPD
jgi:FkbM family methyltransferase